MKNDTDPPVVPDADRRVVHIGDLLIQRGRTARRMSGVCRHERMLYDSFNAFLILVQNFELAKMKMDRRHEKIREAESWALVSRAAKEADRMWRGKSLAPVCRCCGRGVLPEDFANGCSGVSLELERKRRQREKEIKRDSDR